MEKFIPERRKKKVKSQSQENRTANKLGGTVQKGSGSSWTAKGDVKTELFLAENKYTDAASFSVTLRVWDKIKKEAGKAGKIPMMQIDIAHEKLVVLKLSDLLNL